MIIGIGTDLVDKRRIEKALERFGERFARRVLAAEELEQFRTRGESSAFLAKRFAVKEAASKALGCGIGESARLQEIVVTHSERGAPQLLFRGVTAETAHQLGVTNQQVSISDEREMALAFVVLSA